MAAVSIQAKLRSISGRALDPLPHRVRCTTPNSQLVDLLSVWVPFAIVQTRTGEADSPLPSEGEDLWRCVCLRNSKEVRGIDDVSLSKLRRQTG